MSGPTQAQRDAVYERARYRCERCGDAEGPFALHHSNPGNLTFLCEPCHRDVEVGQSLGEQS